MDGFGDDEGTDEPTDVVVVVGIVGTRDEREKAVGSDAKVMLRPLAKALYFPGISSCLPEARRTISFAACVTIAGHLFASDSKSAFEG